MWRLRCNLSTLDILSHLALWVLLSVITCGIALFLFPYSFAGVLINSTRMLDSQGRVVGTLRCTQGTSGHIVHAILWWLLTLITLGVAGFFYAYRVASDMISVTIVDTSG